MRTRTGRRQRARIRVNRAHIRAFLDALRYDPDAMDAPGNAREMRPHIFGQEDWR